MEKLLKVKYNLVKLKYVKKEKNNKVKLRININ